MAQYQWLIYALLGALAAAAIAPLGKMGTKELDPNVMTAVRSVFQALFVLITVTFTGRWQELRQFQVKSFAYAAMCGLAGGISWLFMFKALATPGGNVSNVVPIDKLSMPLAIILAVLFQQERPSMTNWTGIGLMVAGAYLAALKD